MKPEFIIHDGHPLGFFLNVVNTGPHIQRFPTFDVTSAGKDAVLCSQGPKKDRRPIFRCYLMLETWADWQQQQWAICRPPPILAFCDPPNPTLSFQPLTECFRQVMFISHGEVRCYWRPFIDHIQWWSYIQAILETIYIYRPHTYSNGHIAREILRGRERSLRRGDF